MTVKGKIIAKVAPSTTKASATGKGANPKVKPQTPKEKTAWEAASPWVHGVLGVASFVPGLSVVTGGLDAAIYLAEGRAIEAGIAAVSMIPGGKVATTAGKAVKSVVGMAKGAGTAAKVTKVGKTGKATVDAANDAKQAKKAAESANKGKKDTTVKPKPKMKCGEHGKYGDLKKKTGDGEFDRDHIPSKAALKARAEQLNNGEPISTAQAKAIDDWGQAIAIPRQAHINHSPTHGSKNKVLRFSDMDDLAGAARRDVAAMVDEIELYDADGGCKKAYQNAAKKVLKMTNSDYDKALKMLLKSKKGGS